MLEGRRTSQIPNMYSTGSLNKLLFHQLQISFMHFKVTGRKVRWSKKILQDCDLPETFDDQKAMVWGIYKYYLLMKHQLTYEY